jgi:hypothetical protein
MYEQNALIATGDARHIERWKQAVALGDGGAEAVGKVHDPVITRISGQGRS